MHGRSFPRKVVHLLKRNLDETNLVKFRSSCFGRCLEFPKMILQGPFIYYLLQHLDFASQSEGILRFNFNGVNAIFGPKEFLAITGLSFGAPQTIAETSDFAFRMLGRNGRAITKDFERAFIKICLENKGSGDDALKLGLCLFVYGSLIGCGFTDHIVDSKYMNLCDDISSFNSFPWGRVAYEFFVDRFFRSKAVMNRQILRNKNVSVDIFGLALALQVWVFEVFPDIANMRSYSVVGRDRSQPRILGWRCAHKVRYGVFEQTCQGILPLRMVPFTLSKDEELEFRVAMGDNPIFRSLSPPSLALPEENIVLGAKRKLHFNCSEADDEAPPFDGNPTVNLEGGFGLFDNIIIPSSSVEESSNSHSPSVEESIQQKDDISNATSKCADLFNKSQFEYMEVPSLSKPNSDPVCAASFHDNIFENNELSSLFSDADFLDNTMKFPFAEAPSTDLFSCLGGSNMEIDSSWIDQMFPSSEPVQKLSPVEYSADTAPDSGASSNLSHDPGDRATDTMRYNCANCSSPTEVKFVFTGDDVVVDIVISSEKVAAQHSVMYSPMKKYPCSLLQKFLDWYHVAKRDPEKRVFTLPLYMLSSVDLDWIRAIYRPHLKLTDELCDVLLNLLLFKARVAPHMFRAGWTCVESLFWNKCTFSNFEDSSTVAMRYIMGQLPLQGALSWSDATEIYGVAHVMNNHWVAYEVDMIGESIIVYDSLSESNNWETVAAHFTQLSKFIPKWLNEAAATDPNFIVKSEKEQWLVVPFSEALRQQTGVNDCGILAMKYIECLLSLYPVGLVELDKCSKHRRYYCAQLFNSGKSDNSRATALNL